MIFRAGRSLHRTRFQRLRSWRPRRPSSSRSATALAIAHHQGMVEAPRAATADDLRSHERPRVGILCAWTRYRPGRTSREGARAEDEERPGRDEVAGTEQGCLIGGAEFIQPLEEPVTEPVVPVRGAYVWPLHLSASLRRGMARRVVSAMRLRQRFAQATGASAGRART